MTGRFDDGRHPGLVSATPLEFERQLDALIDHFTIVSLDAVLAAVHGEGLLPERAVHLTFDDAVDDFFDHALPALRSRGLPATLFVPTVFVDNPDAWFWWDAVHAAVMSTSRPVLPDAPVGPLPLGSTDERTVAFDRLRSHFKAIPWSRVEIEVEHLVEALDVTPPPANVMSWSQLAETAQSGVSVCPHTRTHPHLDQLDLGDVRDEIAGSLSDLEGKLGAAPKAFAYPSGQWTPAVRDVVADLGFEVAFTTRREAHHVGSGDPLLIGRINVSHRTGLDAVRLQLHPWADRLLSRPSPSARPRVGQATA